MKVVLNIKKTVDQNAQVYFEKAKKARKKLEGARGAMEKFHKKLEAEKNAHETKVSSVKERHAVAAAKVVVKKEWYEKFRWFISSEGFLVIGGRDATTNEIVIKKHTDKEDIVFHTDMAGSPFFVVKKGSNTKHPDAEIGEATIQETANATLCFSRAWKLGLITTPVFWVTPEQVTKEANQGEYLPKGAFMIRGKTTYVTPLTKCSIGKLLDGRIMCGPTNAVLVNCDKSVGIIELQQKAVKVSETAKKIKSKLGGELDDIIKVLPPGNVAIKE